MMDSGVQVAPPWEDWGFKKVQRWELKFCWRPKKCFLTDEDLWGKFAYHGERWITGPGEPIVEHYWVEKNEFLISRLKGRI